MGDEISKKTITAMYRRWAYMVVAILSSSLLFFKPVFNFKEDKGIIYMRSFEMTQTQFLVIQTDLKNGVANIVDSISVKWVYYCNRAMLYGSILCLLCFFSRNWRIWIATFTIAAGGAYYVLLIYYALKISDLFFPTMYPNYMIILPAMVIEMMILVIRNTMEYALFPDEREEQNEE